MAKILYFGPLADMLHKEAEQLALSPEMNTVSALRDTDEIALIPIPRRV